MTVWAAPPPPRARRPTPRRGPAGGARPPRARRARSGRGPRPPGGPPSARPCCPSPMKPIGLAHACAYTPRMLLGLLLVAVAAASWGTTGATMTLLSRDAGVSPLLVGWSRLAVAAPCLLLAAAGAARLGPRRSTRRALARARRPAALRRPRPGDGRLPGLLLPRGDAHRRRRRRAARDLLRPAADRGARRALPRRAAHARSCACRSEWRWPEPRCSWSARAGSARSRAASGWGHSWRSARGYLTPCTRWPPRGFWRASRRSRSPRSPSRWPRCSSPPRCSREPRARARARRGLAAAGLPGSGADRGGLRALHRGAHARARDRGRHRLAARAAHRHHPGPARLRRAPGRRSASPARSCSSPPSPS